MSLQKPTEKLLYIVSHSFFPAKNGGQLRIFHLLSGLLKRFDITVIYPENNKTHLEALKAHFPQLKVIPLNIKQKKIKGIHKIRVKFHFGIGQPLNQFKIKVYEAIKGELKSIHFDLIFFEHLESLAAADRVANTFFPLAKRVINLHNIDHELWLSQYQTQSHKKQLLKYSTKALVAEKKLFKKVDVALVCSEKDQDTIGALNRGRLKTLVVPNGTYIPTEVPETSRKPNSLLFVGALDFFPNIEGLKWFYQNVWPILISQMPDIQWSIVGKGNKENLAFIDHPRVNIIGEVKTVSEYYFNHKISIVPLLHGGGTRLKIPEAMAHRTPVVSTAKGVEGHPIKNKQHLLIANDPETFAEEILELFLNKEKYDKIKTNAKKWVDQNLDWNKISKELTGFLQYELD